MKKRSEGATAPSGATMPVEKKKELRSSMAADMV